ncbi:META domain-containing protein [Acinetobacter ihumii]|uniref:META domain-containing protein n=1 Tax=Acinetobacter ihumii TaxID=2483802 RepID=UPI00102FDBA6|nr:META domain-containing protein [Acinetobacter ihumii]
MKKSLHKLLFLGSFLGLAACQSTTAPVQKNKVASQHAHSRVSPQHVQPARKSVDGVQDVTWTLSLVHQKRTKFFNQTPFLVLNSAVQTVQGSTGCNAIFGRYTYNFALQQLDLDVRAGHQSCDGALAQEAELIDALQRVKRFKLQGNELLMLDQSGQILLQAQKK